MFNARPFRSPALLNHLKALSLVLLALLLLPSNVAWAEEEEVQPEDLLPNVHNVFGPYIELLEEVGVRRRVNVLHANPQSLFDGLQIGFVSVGTGNLTFLRRDVVVRKRGPLVFGRIYDGTIEANADLGKGWRLSLLEEVHVATDGTITYIDGFGGQHTFDRDTSGYIPNPPNPWHTGTTINAHSRDVTLKFCACCYFTVTYSNE